MKQQQAIRTTSITAQAVASSLCPSCFHTKMATMPTPMDEPAMIPVAVELIGSDLPLKCHSRCQNCEVMTKQSTRACKAKAKSLYLTVVSGDNG